VIQQFNKPILKPDLAPQFAILLSSLGSQLVEMSLEFSELQSCLKEWLELHSSRCPALVKDVATLRNKLSYLTKEQLSKVCRVE